MSANPALRLAKNGRDIARVPAVDGLRGLLALFVVFHHTTYPLGAAWTLPVAGWAVFVFFAISGYVLTRSWDGDFPAFLVRRFIRLWPVFALCLATGYLIAGERPVWTEFFWYPVRLPGDPAVDPPTWSLNVEAWAMLSMPLIVWIASAKPKMILLALAALSCVFLVYPKPSIGTMFIGGALLHRYVLRNEFLESPIPQWLGRISYSLYLSHWLVLVLAWRAFGFWVGAAIAFPAALVVGWVIWWVLERPSIWASRKAGRLVSMRTANVGVAATVAPDIPGDEASSA